MLPDAGQVLDHRDVELLQVVCGPDAGEHEELRRVEGAARDDDFPPGRDGFPGARRAGRAAAVGGVERFPFEVFDARGAGGAGARRAASGAAVGGGVEEDARCEGVERDGERDRGVLLRGLDVVACAVPVAVGVLVLHQAVDAGRRVAVCGEGVGVALQEVRHRHG